MIPSYPLNNRQDNAEIVRAPRAGDALGAALRSVFLPPALPAEMTDLLRRLDRVT